MAASNSELHLGLSNDENKDLKEDFFQRQKNSGDEYGCL